jgi:UDP-N-acetylglucosamine/UDP-N-acetylgalactosamine diphosphorylase
LPRALLGVGLLMAGPIKAQCQTELPLMEYSQACEKLHAIDESPLLSHFESLSTAQQQALLSDIHNLDTAALTQQRRTLQAHLSAAPDDVRDKCDAFHDYAYSGDASDISMGQQLIADGKVGALLIAGGQGSRLGFNGPKGTFPISVVNGKYLFQLFAEKVKAASLRYGRPLFLAIMTSPLNHADTLAFFEQHAHFGLDKEQLYFFSQTEMPFLDDQGHLMLHEGFIAKGPDGNGSSLREFVRSHIWQHWQSAGIAYVNYVLIDNPLADPFDAELVGFHAKHQNDMTIKCVEKAYPQERVGLLIQSKEGTKVVEYSEMDTQERTAIADDGKLKHRCANISLFCFNMSFIQKAATLPLPWHLAYKPIAVGAPPAWKFETFIFDIMTATHKVKALLYPRAQCFAPLKNASGPDSIDTVKDALLAYDLEILSQIVGRKISHCQLELAQDFHYPTPELQAKWYNHPGPFSGYISP